MTEFTDGKFRENHAAELPKIGLNSD